MLEVTILTPQKEVFKDSLNEASITTASGEIGVLEEHVELFSIISPGILKLTKKDEINCFKTESGFLHIANNKVSILVKSVAKITQQENS